MQRSQKHECVGCGLLLAGQRLCTDANRTDLDLWHSLPPGWMFRLFYLDEALENGSHLVVIVACSEACARAFLARGGVETWRRNPHHHRDLPVTPDQPS